MMIFCTLQTCRLCCLELCLNNSHSHLIQALLFTKSGFFVNLACEAPNVFVSDFGHLKIKEPSSVAVCIMTGIVTECAIISEGCTGRPDNKKVVHKILIAPFCQEFCHDTMMWGKILYFDNLSCTISAEGVSFTISSRIAVFLKKASADQMWYEQEIDWMEQLLGELEA